MGARFVFQVPLRWLLPLLLLVTTALAAAFSFAYYVRAEEAQLWAETHQQARRELARLTVVGERAVASDVTLLAEMLAQTSTDSRLEWAAVLGPDNKVFAASRRAWLHKNMESVPELAQNDVPGLVRGGMAAATEDRSTDRLTLVQAFEWREAQAPSGATAGRGLILLRYNLTPALQAAWAQSLINHLAQIGVFAVFALVVGWVLNRALVRPMGRLAEAARALGAGEALPDPGQSPVAEMQALEAAFQRMADDLVTTVNHLARSELRFRRLVESAPDAIIVTDVHGRIESFNQAAELLFGYSAEALLGQSLDILLPNRAVAHHPQWMQAFSELRGAAARRLRAGRLVTGRHSSGRELYMEIGISRTGDGPQQRFTAMARDVGERLRTEAELERHRHHLEERVAERTEALRRSRDEAHAAARAKSDFLANMSHEIRTPMNAIIGLAHLTRREATPQQQVHLEKLAGAARHLLAILNDILDFSKIEAGKLSLSPRDHSLEWVVEQSCQMLADRAQGKGVALVRRIAPEVPRHWHGDDLRLGQVLLNLLSNAVKFTTSGHVQLSVARVQAPDGQPRLSFEVQDTGVGMDETQVARLFQPFEQADNSTTRRFGGTGLGLAISQRLVALMGGCITVVSLPNEGSCFRFDLPWQPAQDPTAVPAISGPGLRLRFEGNRALVVDDLPEARQALTEQLELLGLRVATADSGTTALQAVQAADEEKDPFALALIDWHMPGLDGVVTAHRMGSLPVSQVPVRLLVSAARGTWTPESLAQAGIAGALTKPISPSELHDALSQWLRPQPVPSSAAAARPTMPLAEGEVRWSAGLRVMLAEDNPLNQDVGRQLLEAVGLVPTMAPDGLVAVALAREGPFDLILMDVQMPGLDGLEATQLIRGLPQHAHTPIVAMTANAFEDDRRRCRDAGMDDFVAKPVDPELLYAVLRRWLPAPRLGPATAPPPPDRVPAVAPAGVTASLGGMSEPPAAAAPVAAVPSAAPAPTDELAPQVTGLDWAMGLHAVGGNAGLLRRMLGLLRQHHGRDCEDLPALAAAGDAASLLRRLHALKGAAATLGATEVARAAAHAEAQLKAGGVCTPEALAAEVAPVAEALTRLLSALAEAALA